MNPAQGQMPQQSQGPGQPGPAGQQPRPHPMYLPDQIRNLPMLSEEEKSKYEAGLRGLWVKANNSPANSPEQNAARLKIIEFSKMLISKIQQRRSQAQQQQQQQAGQVPVRPPSAQPNPTGQAQAPAQMSTQQQKPSLAAGGGMGFSHADNVTGQAQAQQAQAAVQRPKMPDHILQHASKMTFRSPLQMSDKSAADIAKWADEMRDRYARALFTMESSKSKVSNMEKVFKERTQAGKPLKDEELRQYHLRRDQQLKFYTEAHKWVDTVRKQQESLQSAQQQAHQAQPSAVQPTDATQVTNTNAAQNKPQISANQGPAPPLVNAAAEAAKNQQQLAAASRASPAVTNSQAQVRPGPSPQQAAASQGQAQTPVIKQEHPPPVNTALASSISQAQAQAQAQAPASAPSVSGRPQPPTAAAPGQARSLSHSAALSLANQKAAITPGSAPIQGQQGNASTPSSAVNPGVMQQQPQQQQQQGHPHAHPTQQQQPPLAGLGAKMPIPKHLPEKATAVPQGVTVGGGVSAGRPTLSQGSGTLGGVMNQPPLAKVPAYNHDAEGDHVLSKKKLDEMVRQVCGGSGDGQEGNQLSPEVEENILGMADSFVDNVLHTACRNAKERGSKVLEIRDLQLVLERTYNIRVPGYSSDELRTVRKVMPSAGWIAKMSAVQAAKVMPGKGEI